MHKRCSNCEHCDVDLRAWYVGNVFRKICFHHGHWIKYPFWEGWRCKEWRKENGG